MSENGSTNYGGPGLATLLTVLFVGLKLTGYITWSWWWVLAPIWIAWGLLGGVLVIAMFGVMITFILTAMKDR